MTTAPLRILSLGAGVQSTAVLMLILDGELDAEAAIFADTGWEPRAVYEHLERLEALAAEHEFPIHRVSNGDVRSMGGFCTGSARDVPFFLRHEDGTGGIGRRQCTSKLKIAPIRRKLRELMDERGTRTVVQLFGISVDEYQRVRTSDRKYITHEYPLIDRGWRRSDCASYLASRGMVAPRSACVGCPYHSDHEWRRLRDEAPDEFADAVQWERDIQQNRLGLRAMPFLHRQLVPLDEVDLSTPEDRGQLALTWDDECEGLCGV